VDEAAIWLAERLGLDWEQMRLDDAGRHFTNGEEPGDADQESPSDAEDETTANGNGKASQERTPDMSVLHRHQLPAPQLPLEVFGPFWAPQLAHWAKAAAAPVDYVAASVLTGAAMLIGNSRWVSPHFQWAEPPVLWTMLIGPPSASKSPAMSFMIQIMRDVESDLTRDFAEKVGQWEIADKAAGLHRTEWQKQFDAAIKKGEPHPPLPPTG